MEKKFPDVLGTLIILQKEFIYFDMYLLASYVDVIVGYMHFFLSSIQGYSFVAVVYVSNVCDRTLLKPSLPDKMFNLHFELA